MTRFAERCGLARRRPRAGGAAHAPADRDGRARAGAHRLVRPARRDARQDRWSPRPRGARCDDGMGMVSTLMLKDTSDRTAYKVFEPGGTASLPGFGFANNLLLLPDPESFRELPWTTGTGWLRGQPWFQDGAPVELDTRRVLQRALARLRRAGLRHEAAGWRSSSTSTASPTARPQLDPERAAWPGLPPAVQHDASGLQPAGRGLVGPGRGAAADRAAHGAGAGPAACRRWRSNWARARWKRCSTPPTRSPRPTTWCCSATACGRRCAAPATTPASCAGRRSPTSCPAAGTCTSRWSRRRPGATPSSATRPRPAARRPTRTHTLSDAGRALPRRPAGACPWRWRCSARPPSTASAASGPMLWRRSRCSGAATTAAPCCAWWAQCGDGATRIENRIGEPAANPYLYMASQIHAGPGRHRTPPARRRPPPTRPTAPPTPELPTSLGEALDALRGDAVMGAGFGRDFIDYFATRQAHRNCSATRRPRTRPTSSGASTSAGSRATP